jgi:hypothetical protein
MIFSRLRGLIALALLSAAPSGFSADANAPGDFTIGTNVVAASPPRFGTNIREPAQYNNFTLDPGFEPTTIKRQHVATGGGADYIDNATLNSPGTWHYQTLADGFFDGANVRVYRPTGTTGPLQLVREATIANYITNGWRRLTTLPVSVSQFTDTTAVPGVNYEYQIRAVSTSHIVSANHSTNDAIVPATALAGSTSASNPFFANSFFGRSNTVPATPTGVTATPQPGAVFLDWADNSATELAGYYVYRRTVGAPQFRIMLDSAGPTVQAGDIYFMEMTRDNAPVEFMHDRLGSALNDSWRVLGGTVWPYGLPATMERDASTVCPENGGRTSLRLTDPSTHEVSIRQPRFSTPQFYAGFYPNLTPGVTYRVDVWLKQSGVPSGSVRFALTQHYSSVQRTWTVGADWQKFTHTFTAPALPNNGNIAEIVLAFNGPGTVWVDNLVLYEDADNNPATYPAFALSPAAAQALADFQPSYMRIWTGVDADYWGVTLEDWTNPEPVIQLHWDANNGRRTPDDPYKLPMALSMCRDAGADPWLIVGSFFTEQEWPQLIEYLAAPYDPLVDTPATKPYAFKRYSQGQHAPWTDVFQNIIIEYGNELWNGAYQWNFGSGNTAGQFSEHFFQAAKASPYYAAVASKLKFTVDGWILGTDAVNGYGHAAARVAPSAAYSDLAFYIGGWEAGIAVGGNTVNDVGFQDYMLFSPTYLRNYIDLNATSRDANNTAGFPYKLSVYEAGPGYANPSPGTPFEPISETYGKSLDAGVATLDTFLYNSLRGIDPQAYFSFAPGYNWSSHSTISTGYNPHTSWLALRMRNRHAAGSITGLATHSVPTIDVAARTNSGGAVVSPAAPNTPLLAVYPFRDGANWRVFVLSRKLTGDTPVTLRLPFTSISGGTIYKLTGDPRLNNSTALNVSETQEPLTGFAQNHTFNMPPGSIYVLEYLGTNTAVPANPGATISRAIGQADPTTTPAVQFAVDFSEPVSGFDVSDLQVAGTAVSGVTPSVTLAQGAPFFGTNYLVTVSNFAQSGTVTLNFAAGSANAADDSAPAQAPVLIDGSVNFAFPVPQNLVLASDDFNLTPTANPHILQNVNTGTGWSQGWQVQNYNAATYTDGYKLGTATPLLFSNLRTLGNYAIGGRGYELTSRAFDVAAFQHFAAFGSNPAAVGQSGTTLWMSVLLRKESDDNAPVRFDLVNATSAGEFDRVDVGVGYYGTTSTVSGQRYWTLAVLRDGTNPAAPVMDFVRSNVPVVIGQTTLLVVKMTFGSTDRFDLFVNPASLGGAEPVTPNATFTTTGTQDIRFRTARFRAGLGYGYTNDGTNNGLNKASLDELRFGDTFAAVTPIPNPPPAASATAASGVGFNGATLNAVINPNGLPATMRFEYGLTAAYGSSTSVQNIAATSNPTSVQAILGGLNAGSLYHYRVVVTTSSGTTTSTDLTFRTLSRLATDFDFDGKLDLVWRHDGGAICIWLMDGINYLSGSFFNPAQTDPSWKISGVGDFNQDGKPDLVWRHNGGAICVWFMDGINFVSSAFLNPSVVNPSWKIAAVGDFNQDSKPDLVWRHDGGTIGVWYMDGINLLSGTLFNPGQTDPSWKISGIGDFNQDGKPDLVWRQDSGIVGVWFMDGINLLSGALFNPSQTDPSWKISGVGDFNQDGKPDLVWRHDGGAVYVWFMDGINFLSGSFFNPSQVDPSWKIPGP